MFSSLFIVLTDGSRILGLGDLGVQGIGIPIGKLDMYVAAAGINPQRVLPIMLDVGTNNERLLEDRLSIIQFEDFQFKWAFETLQRYRKKYCMFNDDIQGTAGVALAGLLGVVRAQGRPLSDFVYQKIVVVGAGSAGLGVLNMAYQAVSRMTGSTASPQFYLIDKDGLITKERSRVDPAAAPFAKRVGEVQSIGLREGSDLLEVVLKAMRDSDSPKPAIFAMSNPTDNAECTAADAFMHAGETLFFGSGSPFPNVDLGNGKVGYVNQANNMYLFPGCVFILCYLLLLICYILFNIIFLTRIGLGALLSGARIVSDGMLQAAAEWYELNKIISNKIKIN
ncbi:putative malate dehydrogenase (decarboxylating) [Helianthus annuus]|nr:putative malate dehydrogenase (decarboxylating) [Helianthus annuus]